MFSFHCDKVADKSTMACLPLVCIFLQTFSLLARLFMHGTYHSLKYASSVVARTTLQLIVAPRSVSIVKHRVIEPRIARNQRYAVFAWKAIQRPCAPFFALARISKKTRAIRHMLKSPKTTTGRASSPPSYTKMASRSPEQVETIKAARAAS